MKQNEIFNRFFTVTAISACLALGACHNNDTVSNEEAAENNRELAAANASYTPAMPETNKMMPAPAATANATPGDNGLQAGEQAGMAQPNNAKKGMKGKVSIASPAQSAAKADAQPDATGVYGNAEQNPAFPGGPSGLQKFFDNNVQYPEPAVDNGVEGTVQVAFTVDENGRIVNPGVIGSKQGYGLDNEALRVVEKMPAWIPGKIHGKPVKTRFVLPVKFDLN